MCAVHRTGNAVLSNWPFLKWFEFDAIRWRGEVNNRWFFLQEHKRMPVRNCLPNCLGDRSDDVATTHLTPTIFHNGIRPAGTAEALPERRDADLVG
jgi:hypothetical protein